MKNGEIILNSIKDYFKIHSFSVWDMNKVTRHSSIAGLLCFLASHFWNYNWIYPAIIAFLLGALPHWGLRILPKIEKAILIFIHALNLILLTVVFYLVITPLSYWQRRKDSLNIAWPPTPARSPDTKNPIDPHASTATPQLAHPVSATEYERKNYFVDPY